MTATLDDVTKKSKRQPTAEERAAAELVRRAREQQLARQPEPTTIWSPA